MVKKSVTKTTNKVSSKEVFTSSALLKFYTDMLRIRRFEEKIGQLYGMGLIGGFCHLYIGQEAIAVGIQHSLEKNDSIITTYRDHGIMLTTGSDPLGIIAELMGKQAGCSKGKGGSMHMFDTKLGFYGGHGIVGASVPLGTGLAFAHKYKKEKNICVSYFGDGAANQGQVYEAFNMAALWKLPVLYIIENNEYAMGTSISRSSAITELYKRGEAFGIPGVQVDGMDIFAVIKESKKAIDYIRSGKGPLLLEMKTYRYRGHSMSDPAKYRSKDEVESIKEKHDPINLLEQYLAKTHKIRPEKFKEIDKEIRTELAKIVDTCHNLPEPDEFELWTDIYTQK